MFRAIYISDRRHAATTGLALCGMFDLDDVRAHSGKELRAERHGLHLLNSKDAHAFEGKFGFCAHVHGL